MLLCQCEKGNTHVNAANDVFTLARMCGDTLLCTPAVVTSCARAVHNDLAVETT